MDWSEIDDLLNSQIRKKTDLLTGYEQIEKLLSVNNLPIVEININGLLEKFKGWLVEVLEKEPIPIGIKSIYFGLSEVSFPDVDNGQSKTAVYIAGSSLLPSEDVDWACDPEYLPNRRYLLLDDFEKIDAIKIQNGLTGNYEVLVFNGILNLLVSQAMKELKSQFLTYKSKKFGLLNVIKEREKLNFGAGFDSGDTYLIGELKNE
ncbi:hypothetical protein [uncultured Kordia sp.]|uniref:hypothetical protein n=1 Tax=uncultured Kordia sp. TaxID=507699 RepID=UPI0026289ED2|nr:hypothetical protein [uncultured Kordia sp.]